MSDDFGSLHELVSDELREYLRIEADPPTAVEREICVTATNNSANTLNACDGAGCQLITNGD